MPQKKTFDARWILFALALSALMGFTGKAITQIAHFSNEATLVIVWLTRLWAFQMIASVLIGCLLWQAATDKYKTFAVVLILNFALVVISGSAGGYFLMKAASPATLMGQITFSTLLTIFGLLSILINGRIVRRELYRRI